MIDYKWVVNSIVTQTIEDKDNYVVQVYYQLSAHDGEFSSTRHGVVSFSHDAEQDNFVPYKELTETIVLSWVQNNIGEIEIERIKQTLDENIERERNPSTPQEWKLTELPWK